MHAMKTYRNILYMAAGLLVFAAACSQDSDPTPLPATPQVPTSTVATAAPAVKAPTATPSRPLTDEAQKGPVYERVATWGDDPRLIS
jgi:hypothetical protein